MMPLRRFRGFVLRLVHRRLLAIACGLVLLVPSAFANLSGRWEAWWVDGLSLVVGATGIALVWTGVTGAAPDWVDADHQDADPARSSVRETGRPR